MLRRSAPRCSGRVTDTCSVYAREARSLNCRTWSTGQQQRQQRAFKNFFRTRAVCSLFLLRCDSYAFLHSSPRRLQVRVVAVYNKKKTCSIWVYPKPINVQCTPCSCCTPSAGQCFVAILSWRDEKSAECAMTRRRPLGMHATAVVSFVAHS